MASISSCSATPRTEYSAPELSGTSREVGACDQALPPMIAPAAAVPTASKSRTEGRSREAGESGNELRGVRRSSPMPGHGSACTSWRSRRTPANSSIGSRRSSGPVQAPSRSFVHGVHPPRGRRCASLSAPSGFPTGATVRAGRGAYGAHDRSGRSGQGRRGQIRRDFGRSLATCPP